MPVEHTEAALRALTEHAADFEPHLIVSELRSVAADDLWMSPAQGRDSTCLHFTWHAHPGDVDRLCTLIQHALDPFEARPHWGKVFDPAAVDVARLYARLPDYLELLGRIDPESRFRNGLLRQLLGG